MSLIQDDMSVVEFDLETLKNEETTQQWENDWDDDDGNDSFVQLRKEKKKVLCFLPTCFLCFESHSVLSHVC